ncbi:hypothetical protein K490DRAFT_56796 [Saccharata proteae CBS 121410]|uniref:AA1-like domain-containing protein n=1 Tax=Saccharata proteae CBS 121410 TaxID=1314787 RepID=A0A9P4HVV3_9PEZI|nr:hypothetical protein K490DRAFT_56796 [Saccharata proteae CBS 121410]
MQALTFLLCLVSASPLASALSIPKRAVNLTTFEIPTMSSHFMGANSGIGNGEWPPNAAFNSTLSFVVNYASLSGGAPLNVTCSGNWTESSPPTTWNLCPNSVVSWRFDNFTSPGDFVLEVSRQVSRLSAYAGKVNVTSDDAGDPTSYLTCLEGEPYDGIRCNLDGMLSSTKQPISIAASPAPAA